MGRTKNMLGLMLLCALLNTSYGFALSSPIDPVDKCIYVCVYCFKDNVGVICANECLATEGKMHPFWYKTCPQLTISNLFLNALDFEDDPEFGPKLDNKLH